MNTAQWHKLNNYWYQKIYINDMGELIYTYHYKSKINKAEKTLSIKTNDTTKLCNYILIEKDFRDIKILIKEYQTLLESTELEYLAGITPKPGIIAKGLLTAIVVHYLRCFKPSNKRGYLKDSHLTKKSKETHDFLRKMRNEYLAHADTSEFEKCELVFLIPPGKKLKQNKEVMAFTVFEIHQAFAYKNVVHELIAIIDEQQVYVQDKINKLKDSVNEIILKIDHLKLYAFLERYPNKDSLNQNDLSLL